jgi:hypothetical protein
MIAITLDKGALRKLEKKLSGIANGVPKVISMAANTAIRKGRTELVRQTSSQFSAKPGTIRAAMASPQFASAGGGGASGSLLVAQAGQIPLFDFKVTPRSITNPKLGLTKTGKKRKRRAAKPILAAVRKGGGGSIQGGFVAEMGGHRGVFIRKSGDKRAIKELHGISVPIMAHSAGVSTPVQNVMQKTFDAEIARHAMRLGG